MAGSIDVMLRDLNLDKVESLPDDFDPTTMINDLLLHVANDVKLVNGTEKPREIVLGRNVHSSCLEITEPADDEVTSEREAYTARVLATYQKYLLERNKHHLCNNFFLGRLLYIPEVVFSNRLSFESRLRL
nr:serine decarboxylase-like [Tanacetum cinerariifolium]